MATLSKVQKDEIILIRFYAKVVSKNKDSIDVKEIDNGLNLTISGSKLIESSLSADQFDSEKKSTMTQMSEILLGAKHSPFTVCFTKANGDERILRGRLVNSNLSVNGVQCIDMDIVGKTPLRWVNPKTILWLIMDGVKYILKK